MSFSADDWEVVDDDGFIFKRRKKESSAEQPGKAEEQKCSESQQQFDEKLALRKKIAMLESQKMKYKAEIETWQRLINTEALVILPNEPLIADSLETSENESKDADGSHLNLLATVDAFEDLIERLNKVRKKGEDAANTLEETLKTNATADVIDEVTLLKYTPRTLITRLTSGGLPPGINASAVSSDIGQLLAQTPEGPRNQSL